MGRTARVHLIEFWLRWNQRLTRERLEPFHDNLTLINFNLEQGWLVPTTPGETIEQTLDKICSNASCYTSVVKFEDAEFKKMDEGLRRYVDWANKNRSHRGSYHWNGKDMITITYND